MINGITSTSRHLYVQCGTPANPYINNYGSMGAGNVRYNTTNQCLEVYDGMNWMQLTNSYATVSMSPSAEMALDWAQRKMNEEMVLEQQAKENPAIADLLAPRNQIDHAIKMVQVLTK